MNDIGQYLDIQYPFEWFEHEFYNPQSKGPDAGSHGSCLCFCNEPMVYSKSQLVCAKKRCRFIIDVRSMNLYLKMGIIKNNVMNVAVCKTCNGSTFECYRNSTWNVYLDPLFRCSCKHGDQMLVTRRQFPEKFEHVFDLQPIIKKEGGFQQNVKMVLPKKKLEDEPKQVNDETKKVATSDDEVEEVPKKPIKKTKKVAVSEDDEPVTTPKPPRKPVKKLSDD